MTTNRVKRNKLLRVESILAWGSLIFFLLAMLISFLIMPHLFPVLPNDSVGQVSTASTTGAINGKLGKVPVTPPPLVVTHLPTPVPLKAIYMSSWVAGDKAFRNKLVKLIDETEINAVIIDVKDSTGVISFKVQDPSLKKISSGSARIPDVREFIDLLHKKGVYTIARISVFQDAHLSKARLDLAVKKKDQTTIWQDYKKITWLDAGSKEVWDYTVAVGKEAYAAGFDELNFDYVRFPSDGNMLDVYYPISEGKNKATVIRSFFSYLHSKLSGTGPKLSVDLFGMTTTNKDDLGIGQVLENALPFFDYVAPMVYPSHFPAGFIGIKNPAAEPYKVIHYSMGQALEKVRLASSSAEKLRPWLQDFSLGAVYTAPMVRAQIQATYDLGLDSWMLWDAGNTYTQSALFGPNGQGGPSGQSAPSTASPAI